MKTLSLFSVLLVASAATAANLGEQHEHETPNCCTPAADLAPRASYLVNANPLAEDEIQGTATGKVVFEGEKTTHQDVADRLVAVRGDSDAMPLANE